MLNTHIKASSSSPESLPRHSTATRAREFVEKMNANAERIAKAFRTQKFDAVWDYV